VLKQCDFTHVKAATLVLKFRFCFFSHGLWGKRVVQIMQWFSAVNGPNDFESGAKKL